MKAVLDIVIFLGVPVALIVGLVLAVAWRSRAPRWLPLAALALLALLAAWSLLRIGPNLDSPPKLLVYSALILVAAASAGFMLLSASAIRHGRPNRGRLVLAAFALPLPLVAFLLLVGLSVVDTMVQG